MKLVNLNEWLSFAANIGVLAGVIFLALEIQQSNQIAKATMSTEIANNYSELNQVMFENPEIAELMVKFSDIDFSPNATEKQRGLALAFRFNNIWNAVERAYLEGLVDEEVMVDTYATIESINQAFPGLKPAFLEMLDANRSDERYQTGQHLRKVISQ